MKIKQFQEQSIQIQTENDLTNLRKTYRGDQLISYNCEKCEANSTLKLRKVTSILCSNCKREKTCLEKYGVVNVMQVNNFKEKCLENWTPEKYKQTVLKREKTCLGKYGVTNPAQLFEVKKKVKETFQKHFNSSNFFNSKTFQNNLKDYRKKSSRKYNYQGINFDSSWELAYFIYLVDHNFDFEYQCDPIYYIDYLGKERKYIPDFKIGNQLIEIKGDQFFTKTGSFVNPFDRSPETDMKLSLKLKCMLDHKVTILKNADIKPFLKYVEDKYGKNYLDQFKKLN